MIEPKVTFLQVLKVPFSTVTIGSMTDDLELLAFSKRLNEVCDDMRIPPKGQARQTTLAKIFDVTQKGARKWLEAEGYCSIATGKRIATWAGVSFDWLMTGQGEKRPGGDNPLLLRYQQADDATRILIDIALTRPDAPIPDGLSPTLRTLVDMARAAIRNDIEPNARS